MDCLDETDLLRLVDGSLPAARREQSEHHLRECDTCRRVVAALAELQAGPRWENSTGPVAAHPTPDLLAVGTSLGRYELRERIGIGGMGVVYAAHDAVLDRMVALKLLWREETLADQTAGRLRAEAQALARVRDPHVVTVHEVSTLGDQVFMTMELVEGSTLAGWLRAERRSWRQVLDVFRRAGQGLAAAHAAGLVHRDFKPGNVLLGSNGRVQVTDFGLAQAQPLVGQGHGGGVATETLSRAGTPAYMAPEQLASGQTSPRADQYSFCVSLFEGLHGHRPFAATRTEELLAEMQRGPEWPRSAIPSWLRQALVTGLQFDPARRFESMPALLAALDPLPHSRRRAMVGAAVFGLVSLLGGFALNAVLSRPSPSCQDAARRLDGVWDRARRQEVQDAFGHLTESFAPASFRATVVALDGYADRWAAAYREVCAARGQNLGAADPQLRCLQIRRQQLGELVRVLSHPDVRIAEGAVAAAQSLASPQICTDALALASRNDDAPLAPEAAALGGEVAQVKASGDLGLDDQAIEAAHRVTRRAQELRLPRVEAAARIFAGRSQLRLVQLDAAGQNLEEALVLATAAGDPELIARAWTELVALRGARQDEHGYEHAARMARAAVGSLLSPEADLLVEPEIALGQARTRSRRYREALEALDRAVALGDSRAEVSLRPRLESVLVRSTTYLALDRLADASADSERALGLVEATLGTDHPWRIRALIGAGLLEEDVGRPALALPFYTRAVELAEKAIGPVHPTTAHALVRAGAMLLMQHRLDEARAALVRAEDIERRYYPSTHLTRADLGFLLGSIDWQRDRSAAANEALRALTETERRRNPAGPAWVAFGMSVAENDLELHRVDRATRLLDELRPFTRDRGEMYRAVMLDLDGRAALARRDYREGLETLETAIRIYGGLKAQDGLLYADALKHRSLALQALGRVDEAIAGLEQVGRIQEQQESLEQLAQTRFLLARALWAEPGRRTESLRLAQVALEGTRIAVRRRAVDAWLRARIPAVARAPRMP